jgi:hypothetical protein
LPAIFSKGVAVLKEESIQFYRFAAQLDKLLLKLPATDKGRPLARHTNVGVGVRTRRCSPSTTVLVILLVEAYLSSFYSCIEQLICARCPRKTTSYYAKSTVKH